MASEEDGPSLCEGSEQRRENLSEGLERCHEKEDGEQRQGVRCLDDVLERVAEDVEPDEEHRARPRDRPGCQDASPQHARVVALLVVDGHEATEAPPLSKAKQDPACGRDRQGERKGAVVALSQGADDEHLRRQVEDSRDAATDKQQGGATHLLLAEPGGVTAGRDRRRVEGVATCVAVLRRGGGTSAGAGRGREWRPVTAFPPPEVQSHNRPWTRVGRPTRGRAETGGAPFRRDDARLVMRHHSRAAPQSCPCSKRFLPLPTRRKSRVRQPDPVILRDVVWASVMLSQRR